MKHFLIDKLSNCSCWKEYQVDALCKAVKMNSQVKKIFYDSDIQKFYRDLLEGISIPKYGGR